MKLHTNLIKTNLPILFELLSVYNLFCKYFTNIGPNLASKIPASEKSHSSFLPDPKLVNSIFLEVASEEEIMWKYVVLVVQPLLYDNIGHCRNVRGVGKSMVVFLKN